MNETIKNIIERRSIKKYKNDAVPEELLEEIVKCGTYAANGMGMQSPIIVLVKDRKTRDKLSKINSEIMGMTGDPFYNAPVVAVVLSKKDVPTHIYDGSLVIGNMLLAAHSLGLGACWIHRAKETFEKEEGKEILKELGINPDEYEGIGNCIIGYPDMEAPFAKPRKDDYIYIK